jgi:hypothetical protein
MHYEQSIQFFSHFVRTSTKRESSRPEKRSLSDEDEDDEMMTAARENLIWTQKSNRAQVYPLSTSLPLSRITTRVVHLAYHQHSQKMRRVFFLSLTSSGIVIIIIIIIKKR